MTPETTQRIHSPVVALGWMLVALLSFVGVAIAGREAGKVVSTMELMAYRSWLSLPIVLVMIALSGASLRSVVSRQPLVLTLRTIIHFGAQFSWLKALTLIPLAKLFALEFTAPIWVAILAPFLLGERLTRMRLAAALIGFAGTLVILAGKPAAPGAGFDFTVDLGSALALASAVGFALVMITTRLITRTDGPLTILLYMFAIQSVMCLPVAFTAPKLPDPHTMTAIGSLVVFGLTAHFAIAKAFANADAIVVAPMDLLRLPLIAVVGMWLYDEPLEMMVMAGAAVIVVANLVNLLMERRPPR